MSTKIEYMEVFPDKKEPVRTLLLEAARSRSVIRYSAVYRLFEDERERCDGPGIWSACVWETVEDVCQELASPRGALYTAVLSNKEGIPEAGFSRSAG